jgi:hypothetical protein
MSSHRETTSARNSEESSLVKEVVAFLAAGTAAVVSRAALQFLSPDLVHGPGPDPNWIRVAIALVFFFVLATLGRGIFRTRKAPGPGAAELESTSFSKGTSAETASEMARLFSGVTDDSSRRRAIGEWLSGVPKCTVLIPFIFYLRFGLIDELGWGLTVFFDVYCLLWAIGLFFLPRTEYHSPVRLRGDWIDRVGAFWLIGCAFGPLFGWMVTAALPITQGSWHWVYGLRAALAAGLPIILALPMLRYVRGKSSLVALPLLVAITVLPASTAVPVLRDLWEGVTVRSAQPTGQSELYLSHTGRSLGKVR